MSVSDHQCSRNMLQVSINDSLTVFGGNQVNACLSVARCPSFKQTFPLLMFRHPLAPRSPGGHNNDGNDNENTVDAIQPYSPFIKASRELTAELHSTSVDTVLGNYAQLPHGCRYRLLFLARQCPPLRPQVYAVLAANVAQHSADVTLAQEIKNDLGGGATTVLDDAWLERTRHQQQATTDKLNRELRTYKANLVRESIRVSESKKCTSILSTCTHPVFCVDGVHRLGGPRVRMWRPPVVVPTLFQRPRLLLHFETSCGHVSEVNQGMRGDAQVSAGGGVLREGGARIVWANE